MMRSHWKVENSIWNSRAFWRFDLTWVRPYRTWWTKHSQYHWDKKMQCKNYFTRKVKRGWEDVRWRTDTSVRNCWLAWNAQGNFKWIDKTKSHQKSRDEKEISWKLQKNQRHMRNNQRQNWKLRHLRLPWVIYQKQFPWVLKRLTSFKSLATSLNNIRS